MCCYIKNFLSNKRKKSLGLSFQYRMKTGNEQRQNRGSKKSKEMRRKKWDHGTFRMLQNPRLKKGGVKKIIILDLLIYLEDQPSPCLNQISFCNFKGREEGDWKNLAFRDFFARDNFPDCHLKKYFKGI